MTATDSYRIHSEPRGGHWVAWAMEGSNQAPLGAVIVVGQTQDEAEANARQWAERVTADPTLKRA